MFVCFLRKKDIKFEQHEEIKANKQIISNFTRYHHSKNMYNNKEKTNYLPLILLDMMLLLPLIFE